MTEKEQKLEKYHINPFLDIRSMKESVYKHVDYPSWSNPHMLSLTFKQAILLGKDNWIYINNEYASKNVVHFLNVLNRKLLTRNQIQHKTRIGAFAVREGGRDGPHGRHSHAIRLHYHVLIEHPNPNQCDSLASLVSDEWAKTHWGYNETKVAQADFGGLAYMCKLRTKNGGLLESIDWNVWHPSMKNS